ncbi:MAG: hypothetical protein A2V83_07845 [Nitrospirae bacterium RBG_16_64_22]|nr:MAG: hypothetical protein A2V83_07845 [Nitrospirae bacterium RBG_16_64_22]
MKPSRILFIRRDNVGDLVCTTPAIRAVRQAFPVAKIGVLANSYNAPILAGNPDIDCVYVYEKAKHASGKSRARVHLENARTFWRLRRERYDAAIGCGSPSPRIGRFAFLAGARERIGFVDVGSGGDPAGRPYYTRPIAEPAVDEHEVIRTHRLLEPLGIANPPGDLVLVPDPAEQERFEFARALHPGRGGRPLIAVAISARIERNKWPIEKFGSLIDEIVRRALGTPLLLWAPGPKTSPAFPGDDEAAGSLLSRFGDGAWGYRTETLAALVAAVSRADLVVTPDTGTLHIAAACKKPTVALMTREKSLRWYPWNTPHVVLACGDQVGPVAVDEVLGAVGRLAAGLQCPR